VSSLPLATSSAPDRAALASVHTIFLGDFGAADRSDVVKEKVRVLLMSAKRFTVVDVAEKADAILTGAVGVDASQYKGTTDYAGTVAFFDLSKPRLSAPSGYTNTSAATCLGAAFRPGLRSRWSITS
jgi:hypothetical protein